MIPRATEQRRHKRSYAGDRLGDDKSFWFRGAHAKLRLRTTDIIMFLEMADGVDDETWEWHSAGGVFSEWVASSIEDVGVAAELHALEEHAADPTGASEAIHEAV